MEAAKKGKMETTIAQTTLEINCHCPHCNAWLDVSKQGKEYLDDTLRAEDVEIEVTCEKCKKEFIISEIQY